MVLPTVHSCSDKDNVGSTGRLAGGICGWFSSTSWGEKESGPSKRRGERSAQLHVKLSPVTPKWALGEAEGALALSVHHPQRASGVQPGYLQLVSVGILVSCSRCVPCRSFRRANILQNGSESVLFSLGYEVAEEGRKQETDWFGCSHFLKASPESANWMQSGW